MMAFTTSLATLVELRTIQQRLRSQLDELDEADYRAQFHMELSPAGWHLGHCTFIENYWLHEVVRQDASLTRPVRTIYNPQAIPKDRRGAALPTKDRLLTTVEAQQDANILLLSGDTAQPLPDTELLEDEYLQQFLLQHHGQHLEILRIIRAQQTRRAASVPDLTNRELIARAPSLETKIVPAGNYPIGGENQLAFDNELPAHRFESEGFTIAAFPVTNAQYLGFMEDGGYLDLRHWSTYGWQWLQHRQCRHPEYWGKDARQRWYGIGPQGAHALEAEDPVVGISYHEAQAFAAWAGARLPHEYEWEAAHRSLHLQKTGQVWEWCANAFHPYTGFTAFPYREYSSPWFDGGHFTLRGGSLYTEDALRRSSFRNFYTPGTRHVFAGVRLAL